MPKGGRHFFTQTKHLFLNTKIFKHEIFSYVRCLVQSDFRLVNIKTTTKSSNLEAIHFSKHPICRTVPNILTELYGLP